MVNHTLLFIFLCFSFLLNSCSHMTQKMSYEDATKDMEAFVDEFVNKCVGRDIVKDPYPEVGHKFYKKLAFGTGEEGVKGQCTLTRNRSDYAGTFDKSFFIYRRWATLLKVLKKEFGVIHHAWTRFINHCTHGQVHDFILRDGKTHLLIQFANDYSKNHGCYQSHWQGLSVQLNRTGIRDPKNMTIKDDESYLVRRVDVLNKDQLTELEKREVAMRTERLSEEKRARKARNLGLEITSSNSLLRYYARERKSLIESDRAIRRLERQQEEAFQDQLGQQLALGFMGLQQQLAEKTRKTQQRTRQNQISRQAPKFQSSPNKPINTTQLFKDIPNFYPDQLDESVTYREESQEDTNPSPSSATTLNPETKKEKSKVYEPVQESVQREMDSWFSDKSLAISYARLSASNEIKRICEKKGAKADPLRYSQIKSENAPGRWNFSGPVCRRGGWEDKEWKCQAEVSGTCFRYQ